MAEWNLGELRQKIRQVTGRFSPQELTNEQLDEYINKFFQYTFPAEVKLERFHTYFEFLTESNKQKYTYPSGYVNFEPPATIDNKSLLWYQEPSTFLSENPENVGRQTISTGDGSTVTFTATANNFPILPGTSVVTDGTEVFEDTSTSYSTSNINITGSLGGAATLNLSTGALSVTFNTAPTDGENIYFSYIQFQAGQPHSVLAYNNQFTFFPVPDTAYRFKVKAYADSLVVTDDGTVTTTFTNATDRPLLDQWGPCIAYGTSRDIHADKGEIQAYQEVTMLYKEQLGYVLRRTNQNLLNTRAMPHF